jgi:hypothetical protein
VKKTVNDKIGQKVKTFGSIHTLRSLPDQEGAVCKVWFRLVQRYVFVYGTNKHTHTHKLTFSFIYELKCVIKISSTYIYIYLIYNMYCRVSKIIKLLFGSRFVSSAAEH